MTPPARSHGTLSRAALALLLSAALLPAAEVRIVRVPDGGFKASAAVDPAGTLHLVFFKGEPSGGDAFYTSSRDGGATFGKAIRVNSQPGSVLGVSSARGPHLALGCGGRIHILWPGSRTAQPRGPLNPALPADSPFNGTPLLYARLEGPVFTPQRNLLRRTTALDGDSAIAADRNGRVFAAWHALSADGSARDEAGRAIWLARSEDDGATFTDETDILPERTGVCACCALALNTSADGRIAILYRTATERTHRGMRLLVSEGRGTSFTARQLDDWQLALCPMSTAALLPARDGFIGAWETAGAIRFAAFPAPPAEIPGPGAGRKHPALAVNARGELLLAWSERTGFGRGGELAWRCFDAKGKPLLVEGRTGDFPAHGSAAAVAFPDGRFAVIY